MTEEDKIHECDKIPNDRILITYFNFDGEERKWFLEICRYATEEDLEEYHHLEQIGDGIWTTRIQIEYCPYCGIYLEGSPISKTDSNFHIRHIDSSGFYSKYM